MENITTNTAIKTLGQLKQSGYVSRSIKQELRDNLVQKIKNKEEVFSGIYGYEETVIPQLKRAILSQHNINLLGLRGQAKTRLARLMIELLDEYIPVVSGSEINDDPLQPISKYARDLIAEKGDDTPINWLHRSERYFEKLATPDVSVADLIGDVDPIKAANLRLPYSDERVIHFGMIPRAHRCLFVINELPDLQARIQVALFNILQEGDIQIRGFNLRLALDVQFLFTANPEDYTNRGSIVTPLKDRIGSQILTHYPEDIQIAESITRQEAKIQKEQAEKIEIGNLCGLLLEQIAFEARESEFVDSKSGISARLSISALENLMSTAELRLLNSGEEKTHIRLCDFDGIIPAITGKVELVYEGEQEGPELVAEHLIGAAVKTFAKRMFPPIDKLKAVDDKNPYNKFLEWFSKGNEIEISVMQSNAEYKNELEKVPGLLDFVRKHNDLDSIHEQYVLAEMVLWALSDYNKLSREKNKQAMTFSDLYSNYLNKNMDDFEQ